MSAPPHENSLILVLCRVSTAWRWMTGDTHSQISISPKTSSSSVGHFDVSTPRVGGQARRSMDIRPGVHRSVLEVGARLVGTKDRYRGNNPSLTPYAHLASRIASKLRFFANDARHCFSNLSFWPTVELDFSFSQATMKEGQSLAVPFPSSRASSTCAALSLDASFSFSIVVAILLAVSLRLDALLYNRRRASSTLAFNAREWVREVPDLYDRTTTPCALTSPQPAVDVHLTGCPSLVIVAALTQIWHKNIHCMTSRRLPHD
ncbi:hypothetical protein IW261DRAFT_1614991 [Armillaria novae-zelandiae]|uniref:Uncharacterized protein n=1 Tax=Armillaria novae-zelandiae TaxID=153914 RepID=A0AA39KEW5_9AGAR|nr:hypothetical protein IW261DRAFT_1614991 [Armillaria novae-zelandiae]